MQPLDVLIRNARAWADDPSGALLANPAATSEAVRILQICNACRYCEGYCAVFPAMTRRLSFGEADVHYLANLCHNCGSCLHACQYAPPHEFAVNVPQTMARVRADTYVRYAWPRAFGALYARNGVVVSLALAAGIALFLVLALALFGTLSYASPGGDFYAVFPHTPMVGIFGPVFVYALLALGIGATRFARDTSTGVQGSLGPAALSDATLAAATLRYLGGGHGKGCNNEDDRFSRGRRHCHQTLFYGFVLCFLSTCIATVYHYAFRLEAPYAYTSVPTLLGIVGGIGIAIGSLGLLRLNLRRHPLQGDPRQKPMDLGFIVLLFIVAVTGLALAAWRAHEAMPVLLAVHLGAVIALFVTMPYGKFAHAPMRAVALVKWAIERREPNRVGLPDD